MVCLSHFRLANQIFPATADWAWHIAFRVAFVQLCMLRNAAKEQRKSFSFVPAHLFLNNAVQFALNFYHCCGCHSEGFWLAALIISCSNWPKSTYFLMKLVKMVSLRWACYSGFPHCGVCNAASQQEGCRFDSRSEFLSSPGVCLQVVRLPPQSKNMHVRPVCHSE